MTTFVRWMLFLWVLAVASPIRYWPMDDNPQTAWITQLAYAGSGVDTAWVYALNYAAANGIRIGSDFFWTTGLLGHLAAPMDIGTNLRTALLVQTGLWVAIGLVLADVFFRRGIRLRNLALFSLCFALSGPLYWFNMVGVENLLIAAGLILLLGAWTQESRWRYVAALVLFGFTPLLKLTAGILAAGAVAGYLVAQAVRRHGVPWREIAWTALPLGMFGTACAWLLPSWSAFPTYLRASLEMISGYSAAMSVAVPDGAFEFGGALQIAAGLGALLFMHSREHRRLSWFLVALAAIPVLLSFKHGFVRQESHVANYFCFLALVHALAMLALPVEGRRVGLSLLVMFNCAIVSAQYLILRVGPPAAVEMVSGRAGPRLAWTALTNGLHPPGLTTRDPHVEGQPVFEPVLVEGIGDAPVASLTPVYSGVYFGSRQFGLLPVIQQYTAFTPYLDQLNAAWVRDRGPQFLIAAAWSIDGRHFWAESPATWLETYRWYETVRVGQRQLLLRRRAEPRFHRLDPVAKTTVRWQDGIAMRPDASYWSLSCGPSLEGRLRKLAFRVPEVRIVPRDSYRAIVDVLSAPVPQALPSTLAELAAYLSPELAPPNVPPARLRFTGPGMGSYQATCSVQYWNVE